MTPPQGVVIRTTVPADLDAVGAILQDSYPALMAAAYAPDVLAAALPSIMRPNPALLRSGTYFMAEADGQKVGCGGWTREAPRTGEVVPGLAHLRHFGVRASAAGRGIGRMIYQRCEDGAVAAGIRTLLCFSNLNAVAFYAAMGFQSVEPMEVPLGTGVALPAMLMRRELTQSAPASKP